MIPLYLPAPGTQEKHSSQNSSQCLWVGSTPALLRGGQAKSFGQRVMTEQGPADPGHRDLDGGLFGTRKVKPPGREQHLESHMRLRLENSRELLLGSFSSLQMEENRYMSSSVKFNT